MVLKEEKVLDVKTSLSKTNLQNNLQLVSIYDVHI